MEYEATGQMETCPKCGEDGLYVEDNPDYTGEEWGDYIVSCWRCDWWDRLVYSAYDAAFERMKELSPDTRPIEILESPPCS